MSSLPVLFKGEWWKEQAKCRGQDPAFFYPHDAMGVIAAQRFCEDCPVKPECLEHALVNEIENGVWGGESERGRRRLLRRRA